MVWHLWVLSKYTIALCTLIHEGAMKLRRCFGKAEMIVLRYALDEGIVQLNHTKSKDKQISDR